MTFLDSLLGREPDPTRGWPKIDSILPELDIRQMTLGPLRFGDELGAAAFLGRPDLFNWTVDGYCELVYARCGLQIDFDQGRLAFIAFLIGPDEFLPSVSGMTFAQPRIAGGGTFTSATDGNDVRGLFGPPESEDEDSEETILNYSRQGVSMEFELNQDGRLKRWNLYPEAETA